MLSRFKSALVLSPHVDDGELGVGFEFLDVAHLLGSGVPRATAMRQPRS